MISIEQFNVYKKEHWDLYNDLKKDSSIKKNVNSILAINMLSYTIKNDKEYIGMLKIIQEINNFSIDMGILKQYRNFGYGTKALENALEIIDFIDEEYNKIIIRTNFSNKAVIEASREIGFTYDIEEIEKCIDEGENYLVLSKYNNKNKLKTMI